MLPSEIKVPDDYKDEQDFLRAMRKEFDLDLQADKDNRDAGLEDSEFFVGKQWPDKLREKREKANKPVLTFNRLIAFVAQIIGNWRLNETVIKVLPDNGGTKEVAQVRENLLRSIQKVSRALVAYNKALENSAICGIGNFQVHLDYADDDVFEQDIKVAQIPNPWAVIWDRMSVDPTGKDAERVWVIDILPDDVFKDRYPGKTPADITIDTVLLGELTSSGWILNSTVRVVTYWRMRTRKRTLALMRDGAVADLTGKSLTDMVAGPVGPDGQPTQIMLAENIVHREDGTPVMREANRHYAQMYRCSGTNILEGPYELPLKRVPVFRVPAWEVNAGEVKHRWGLVRFLKDPQRLHNYWRSTIAEKLMKNTKAQWIAPDTAVSGREPEWRDSHLSDDNLLIYNGEAGIKPERTPPEQMEPALIQEAGATTQDLKDISNMHEANLGQPSNEVSGKAIVARQRVGELGSVIYQDNLTLAIEECGYVINDLIPVAYDGPRIVKVIGPDDKEALQVINDPNHPESVDITSGKYSVSMTTGPSYATKRLEAIDSMIAFFNAAPQAMSVALDKLVENMDWPGADEIARRFKLTLPPGMIDTDDMTPQQKQAAAQSQAAQEQQSQFNMAMAKTSLDKAQAEVRKLQADADLAEANAEKSRASIPNDQLKTASDAAHKEATTRLAAIDTAHADDNAGPAPTNPIHDDLDVSIKQAQLRKLNAQADEAETKARQTASTIPTPA